MASVVWTNPVNPVTIKVKRFLFYKSFNFKAKKSKLKCLLFCVLMMLEKA